MPNELQSKTTGCQLKISWFGTKRIFNDGQTQVVADAFQANRKVILASKKIINTKNTEWRKLTKIRSKVYETWHDLTYPYPEPGTRLIANNTIQILNSTVEGYTNQLQDILATFPYEDLIEEAQKELGNLFQINDYPDKWHFRDIFKFTLAYITIEPPSYLMQISPQIYQQELERVRKQFDEAAELTETMFATKFNDLLTNLRDKLTDEPGVNKIIKGSVIDNFTEFFEKFDSMKISDTQQLNDLVADAKLLLDGVDAKRIRKSESLRAELLEQTNTLASNLANLVEVKKKRKIIPSLQTQAAE